MLETADALDCRKVKTMLRLVLRLVLALVLTLDLLPVLTLSFCRSSS